MIGRILETLRGIVLSKEADEVVKGSNTVSELLERLVPMVIGAAVLAILKDSSTPRRG